MISLLHMLALFKSNSSKFYKFWPPKLFKLFTWFTYNVLCMNILLDTHKSQIFHKLAYMIRHSLLFYKKWQWHLKHYRWTIRTLCFMKTLENLFCDINISEIVVIYYLWGYRKQTHPQAINPAMVKYNFSPSNHTS